MRVDSSFEVKQLRSQKQKDNAVDLATCGSCGRSWDDGIFTRWTPAPSGRCPFEYYHKELSK